MSDPALLEDCALVMAHPDGEVLWASPILARAPRVILCFGEVPGKPALSAGRARALAAFPRPVEHLALPASGIFDRADWLLPAETPHGLAVAGAERARRYAQTHARLTGLLRARLRGCAAARAAATSSPMGSGANTDTRSMSRCCAPTRRRNPRSASGSGRRAIVATSPRR